MFCRILNTKFTVTRDVPFQRSFDIEKDEHPVKFVLEKLSASLMPAVYTWLVGLLSPDVVFPEPAAALAPAPWFQEQPMALVGVGVGGIMWNLTCQTLQNHLYVSFVM